MIPQQKTTSLEILRDKKKREREREYGEERLDEHYINFLKTMTNLTLMTTHLVSGTCELPCPTMCFWNEVEVLPVCDGNTADYGHEGSSAAASPSRYEHLQERNLIWTKQGKPMQCEHTLQNMAFFTFADISWGRAALMFFHYDSMTTNQQHQ